MTTKQFKRLKAFDDMANKRIEMGMDIPRPSKAKAKEHNISPKEMVTHKSYSKWERPYLGHEATV